MSQESIELIEARQHLNQFERASNDHEGLYHLSEALALLRDIIDSDAADPDKTIAKNLVTTHSKNVLLKAKRILSAEDEQKVEYGYNLMREFKKAGFEISEDFNSTKDQLCTEYAKILLSQLSPSERSILLRELQSDG